MTLRNAYEFALIECNKLKAPSILLEDYIYLFNKAIQQYINSVYNRLEYNQQSSDDLGFLQTISVLEWDSSKSPVKEFNDTVWEFELPKDYVHLMNCIAEFSPGENTYSGRCSGKSSKTVSRQCNRLTADLYSGILNNYYMKPSHTKPYYYIVNRNEKTEGSDVTNKAMDDKIEKGSYKNTTVDDREGGASAYSDNDEYWISSFMKETGDRTSNQSSVRLEIHSGDDTWKLNKIYVTYLKAPMYVSMTQDQILSEEDTTPVLEFPDYVCYEIINVYVKLLLENASDPRIQTNIPINQSIAAPGSK